MPHTLYAADVSLYSGKARAALRYKAIPFREALPSRRIMEATLYPKTGVRMVPVLHTQDGRWVQDTTCILDTLEALSPTPPIDPAAPGPRIASMLLELYGDEWLLLPAMAWRWSHLHTQLPFLAREFGALREPTWPRATQWIAGLPLVAYFGLGHGPVLGLDRRTRRAVRRTYDAFLDAFDEHLAGLPYVLGDRPTRADFAFYGPLFAHLYRDPVSGRHMRARAPRVADWVVRLTDGARDAGPSLTASLPPVAQHALDHARRELVPVLQDTTERTRAWLETHPDDATLPRFLGRHAFVTGGEAGSRAVQPYQAWMAQRVRDAWQGLSPNAKAEAAAYLGDSRHTSWLDALPHLAIAWRQGRVRRHPATDNSYTGVPKPPKPTPT